MNANGRSGTGEEIVGYRIQSVVGEGGMGIVYLAERPEGGLCALKVLSKQLSLDPSFVARFKREAEYAQALDHPHIPQLYGAGEAPAGTMYFAMQYVSGPDLGALLARDGVLDIGRALLILDQIGDALDCAHSRGLFHRDVKPGNIIVSDEQSSSPYAYLTDFGLSKNPDEDSIALTKQGQFVGTTAYTAPEQILGQPSDHRVDIYSLGCVLYEALVGASPFAREHELDVMYAHIGDPRPSASEHRADLPAEIDAIIAKAMAISPDDRYSTCAEFIAAATALIPEAAVNERASAETATEDSQVSTLAATGSPQRSGLAPTLPRSLKLVVRSGEAKGRALLVNDGIELGRLVTLDGALAVDAEISRHHARVWPEPDGGFLIEDQGSANGTFVNGERIAGQHPLRGGDELRIGATFIDVVTSAPEGSAPSADEQSKRLGLRLELDLEAGEMSITIDHGPSVRIVRDGDGWRAETP